MKKHDADKERRENEIAVLQESYHALTDRTSFDRLMLAWDRLLERNRGDLKSLRMQRHFELISPLLDDPSPLDHDRHIAAIVNDFRVPAMLLNTDLAVVRSNLKMENVWSLTSGSSFEPRFADERSAEEFASVRGAVSGKSNRRRALVNLVDSEGGSVLALVGAHEVGDRARPLLRVELLQRGLGADGRSLLRHTFALTEAELEVCDAFMCSASIQQVAEQRGTSSATVKRQLAQIFEKTGVTRQIDLLSLLVGVAGVELPEADADMPKWRDPYDRLAFVDDDGPALAYTWTGHPDGRPAVLVHGPMTGYAMQPLVGRKLEQAGIKLLCLIRPGFGPSAPDRTRPAVEAGAGAISRLIDHFGLEACPLIGINAGVVPVVRFAATNPGRVSALGNIGGYLPLATSQQRKHLAINHRIFFNVTSVAPLAADYMARLAWRNARDLGAEFVWSKLYQDSQIDQRTMLDSRILPYSFAAMTMTMCQGHDTFRRDLALQIDDWAAHLENLPVPLHILAGDSDPNAPADAIRDFAARHPSISLQFLTGGSQTLIHSHPRDCAAFLANLAAIGS
ncbi:MAG: alpha/beta hydrolase [Pseudomonadota bacterium]|nr:alpha/beta hydrolase [Pseudomonadota bacterium]